MNLNDMFCLEGRVAVITGGSRHLGFDMAEILAEAGCDLVITSRVLDSAKSAAEELGKRTGRKVHPLALDLTEVSQIESFAAEAWGWQGKVDILVSDEVFSQVQDVSQMAEDVESSLAGMMGQPSSEGDLPAETDKTSMVVPDELPIDLFPEGEEPKEGLEWGGLDLTLEDDPAEGGRDDEEPDD